MDFLRQQMKTANKMVNQFNKMNGANNQFIEELKKSLPEDQRSVVESFQAKAANILKTAKSGGDYSELLRKATEEAEKYKQNGGNNNKP